MIVIAVAAAIFYFSAQNATESSKTSGVFLRIILELFPGFNSMTRAAQTDMIESMMTVIRKCAHFSIYAFLGFWLLFLVRQYRPKHAIPITVASSFLYAITDELHQHFVPGRSCQIIDVFIDTAGALTGGLVALLLVAIWRKVRKIWSRKK